MATKTISIMEDVYELLINHKKPNESFSEELRRLVPQKGNIMECAGLWSEMSDKETQDMKKNIENFGKKFTKSLLRETRNT